MDGASRKLIPRYANATHHRCRLIALVVMVLAVCEFASGQSSPPSASENRLDLLDSQLQKRGDVTFRKTSLPEAVFLLSEVWGVNIVAGGTVEGEVSGTFSNAPLAEVLDAVLGANGFGYRRSGQSLVIMSLDSIGVDDPNLLSDTLQLPASADQNEAIISAAKLLLSSRGRLQAIPNHNSVLVIDTSDRIEGVRRFLENAHSRSASNEPEGRFLEGSSGGLVNNANPMVAAAAVPKILYFAPQFVSAEELLPPLTSALASDAVMSVMVEENRLMVIGSEADLRIAEQIVDALDVPRSQVRIAALIYDVELRRNQELGIDWGNTLQINGAFGVANNATAGGATAGATTGAAAGGAAEAATSAALTGMAVTLGTLGDTLTLGNVIRALDTTRGAHLLADPTIMVGDRSEASIKIVTKIPFQQLTQTQQGGNIGTTAFEEAGIILTVTPRIARDGTIQMKVRPEFSTLVEYVNGQPLIDSRTAETDVRIADKHTLVIGGLRRKQMRDDISGLPGLMNIRKLGRLFGAHDSGATESELLVFLRPEIVTPFDGLRPRESAAATVSEIQLDSIPVADLCPMVPYCNDRHCVYHHPRKNVNAGGPSLNNFGGDLIGGFGMEHIEHGTRRQAIESVPVSDELYYELPAFPSVEDNEQAYRDNADRPTVIVSERPRLNK